MVLGEYQYHVWCGCWLRIDPVAREAHMSAPGARRAHTAALDTLPRCTWAARQRHPPERRSLRPPREGRTMSVHRYARCLSFIRQMIAVSTSLSREEETFISQFFARITIQSRKRCQRGLSCSLFLANSCPPARAEDALSRVVVDVAFD